MATSKSGWTYYHNDQVVEEDEFRRIEAEHALWVKEEEKRIAAERAAIMKEEAKASKKKSTRK